jgi:hypothetical protein
VQLNCTKWLHLARQNVVNTPLTANIANICCDIPASMTKQYPMRIEEETWAKAKAMAALHRITMRRALEILLRDWIDGHIVILEGVAFGAEPDNGKGKNGET